MAHLVWNAAAGDMVNSKVPREQFRGLTGMKLLVGGVDHAAERPIS